MGIINDKKKFFYTLDNFKIHNNHLPAYLRSKDKPNGILNAISLYNTRKVQTINFPDAD